MAQATIDVQDKDIEVALAFLHHRREFIICHDP
jgi:hypothetical protein